MTNKQSLNMLFMSLLLGVLIVAFILTLISLGVSHPLPWIILTIVIAIPIYNNISDKRRYVTWKDSYSVGINVIDDDHRNLLTLINHLQTAIRYQTGESFERQALNELVEYTKFHFKREEDLLQQHAYPEFNEHKAEHAAMIAKVDEFVQAYQREGHEALEDVAEYLKNWLVNHINGTDQKYASYLHSKGVS